MIDLSTRGFMGFRKNGEISGYYNHFDSYYEGLGLYALRFYKKYNREKLNEIFLNKIQFIEKDNSDQYYENHKTFFEIDWESQSSILKLQDGSGFLWDGLFCEYGYIINLDHDMLEVYRGFFKHPYKDGQKFLESHSGTNYYSQPVITITRENINQIEELFEGKFYDDHLDEGYFNRSYYEDYIINDRQWVYENIDQLKIEEQVFEDLKNNLFLKNLYQTKEITAYQYEKDRIVLECIFGDLDYTEGLSFRFSKYADDGMLENVSNQKIPKELKEIARKFARIQYMKTRLPELFRQKEA
jgi:hypothetical protein